MKQRVMIAIALVGKPSIIIADEPTTSLDVTIEAQILDLLKELRDKMNTSIILITHDLGVIAKMCDRVLVMYGGKVAEKGTVDEIFYETAHPVHGRSHQINRYAGYLQESEAGADRWNSAGSVCTAERMPVCSAL